MKQTIENTVSDKHPPALKQFFRRVDEASDVIEGLCWNVLASLKHRQSMSSLSVRISLDIENSPFEKATFDRVMVVVSENVPSPIVSVVSLGRSNQSLTLNHHTLHTQTCDLPQRIMFYSD